VASLYRRIVALHANGHTAKSHAAKSHTAKSHTAKSHPPAALRLKGHQATHTPILSSSSSSSSSVVVDGIALPAAPLLASIDAFYESDEAKALVDQAMQEQQTEEAEGGIGAGTDVMAADALINLQKGDLDFENEWANAGEHSVAQSHAGEASWRAELYMAQRDLASSLAVLQAANAKLSNDRTALKPLQETLTSATEGVTSAQATLDAATAALDAAKEALTAAQDNHGDTSSAHTAAQDELAAKEAELEEANNAYRDALAALTDATGDSALTIQDVMAVGTAQLSVAALSAQVSSLAGEAAMALSTHETSASSLAGAEAGEAGATADFSSASLALTTAEGAESDAQTAVDAQQAVVDASLADQQQKQAVYDKLKETVETEEQKQTAASEAAMLSAMEAYNRAMREWGMDLPPAA